MLCKLRAVLSSEELPYILPSVGTARQTVAQVSNLFTMI